MKKILFSISAALLLISCSNTDDQIITSNDQFLDGYFVSNEGAFTKGNASVSHIKADLSSITNNVYKSANGKGAGDVMQTMAVTDKYVFIVMNNSNTIEVVDKKSFKTVYTITNHLKSPRYAVVKNNKLYVTLLSDAQVNVYNAETFDFINSVKIDYPAEQIVATNNYVYAANNFYSGGTRLEMIDISSDINTKDIVFNEGVNSIATNGNDVFVMTNNDTNSFIYSVNEDKIEKSIDLKLSNGRNLVNDGVNLFYTIDTDVFKIDNQLNNPTKLFNVGSGDAYSLIYGFNVFNGTIFIGNAGNFADNGKVFIYNQEGKVLKEFTSGVGTNGFYKY